MIPRCFGRDFNLKDGRFVYAVRGSKVVSENVKQKIISIIFLPRLLCTYHKGLAPNGLQHRSMAKVMLLSFLFHWGVGGGLKLGGFLWEAYLGWRGESKHFSSEFVTKSKNALNKNLTYFALN